MAEKMAKDNVKKKERLLILEDGSVFRGRAIGSDNFKIGELVFNTSMTGYQEILTDNSYCGQIVTMTYPLIGNYGINGEDNESMESKVFGFVVRDYCQHPSNWRSQETLDVFLCRQNVAGICDVDTRAITGKLRDKGTMKATLADATCDVDKVVATLKQWEPMTNQVEQVSTGRVFPIPNRGKKVVLMDFGAKLGIIRELSMRGCDLIVVPYNTSWQEIMAYRPEGVMLSNGPGDPKDLPQVVENIRELMERTVIFGICLGHQLLALAGGAKTYKLKFGHRGANHPVKDLESGRVHITSQNHGYAVDEQSLEHTDFILTHTALNDGSCEGIKHKKLPCFSVQYHPEASSGPNDSKYLFDQFIALMKSQENR